jgi:hypothetical protein
MIMTQKEKNLLLKDLCARVPFDVKINEDMQRDFILIGLTKDRVFATCEVATYGVKGLLNDFPIEFIKPYLFPLSSITEEQSMELFKLFGISLVDSDYIKINECTGITFFLNQGFDVETHLDKLIDWLNKNHFDWRGLIPMGLAIGATGLNIY